MAVKFRVLTYNVRGLRDDRRVLADIVRVADPDVVCVQEAPKYLRWRSRCSALARDWGLLYVTGGGTTGGTMLLAHLRVDVDGSREVCLSRTSGWPARGVAATEVAKGGARLAVASMHLPLDAAARLGHVDRAVGLLRGYPTPYAVAAGDLNEPPGRPAWDALHRAGLRDPDPTAGPTFPAVAPRQRIDAVLVSDGVEVVDCQVVDQPGVERASDHRPVLAVLRVPTG